jgi:hypothetical protein
VVLASSLAIGYSQSSPEAIIDSAKAAEQSAGIRPTANFSRVDLRLTAYYRCYYTGKLELPATYNDLKLRRGSKDGCALDEQQYDVFFYPIEAVASGHTPVTAALGTASAERIATVVPHEDFHQQIRELPDPIAEAAATLVGFVIGDAIGKPKPSSLADPVLFLEKANLVNRYYRELSALYEAAQGDQPSEQRALDQKSVLFAALERECRAIPGESRSFNKCVSAPNNAGLAFDYTYTKDYPLLYRVFLACARDARCTVQTIVNAPGKRPEPEVVAYFENFISAAAAHTRPD